jgi:cytochrome c oxidase subunit 3
LSEVAPPHAAADHAHHPNLVHHFENLHEQKEAASLGMWLFIAQEVMFFGGLFLAYAVYRNVYYDAFVEASHHLDWKLGAVNTAVLICSSLTMALGVHAAALGHRRSTVAWLVATVVLGGVFLVVKFFEYRDKFLHHLAMTGLHALHMIIGVPIILVIAWLAHKGRYGPAYFTPVEMTGLYWHFVDIVWIFLFPLLYLVGSH